MTGGAVNTGGGGWVGGMIGGGGVEGGLVVSSISFTRVRVVQNGAMGKLIAGGQGKRIKLGFGGAEAESRVQLGAPFLKVWIGLSGLDY